MSEPVLVNVAKEIGATRYNGGWTKSVTGLDKTKDNGFSLVGEFVQAGLRPLQPGLYLDCGIGGSRKNQTHTYNLVEVTAAGQVNVLETVEGRSGYDRNRSGGDWAVRLWPAIEAWQRSQEVAGAEGREDDPAMKAAREIWRHVGGVSTPDNIAGLIRSAYAQGQEAKTA